MMSGLASNTLTPAHSATSAVNWPFSSTGTTRAIPSASHTRWSSSPNPGARWTTPVPSVVSTKSPASTRKLAGLSAKYPNRGV